MCIYTYIHIHTHLAYTFISACSGWPHPHGVLHTRTYSYISHTKKNKKNSQTHQYLSKSIGVFYV